METELETTYDEGTNTVQLSGYVSASDRTKVPAGKTPPAALQISGLDTKTNTWVPVTVRKDGYFNLHGVDLVHVSVRYSLDSGETV